MKKLSALILIPLKLALTGFICLAEQVVQTPAEQVAKPPVEKVSTGLSWPQVTTILVVTTVSFGGLIMWQWIRKRR